MVAQATFEILSGDDHLRSSRPGSLVRMLRVCRDLAQSLNMDIRAGALPPRFCAKSSEYRHPVFGDVSDDVGALMHDYPLDLQSPFEGVAAIHGGIWKASDLCGGNDALLKLRFDRGTVDLPLHSHDHSDRVIFVADGSGVFECVAESEFAEPTAVPIGRGDMLLFTRGTVHRFETESSELVLLSYHFPFIELDDPKQYTVVTRG